MSEQSEDFMRGLLAAINRDACERERPKIAPEVLALDLQNKLKELHAPTDLKIGDIVRWKPGLKNTRFPEYGEPMIISDLAPPPTEIRGSGLPVFRDAVAVLFFDPRGEAEEYYMDPRRLEVWTPPAV